MGASFGPYMANDVNIIDEVTECDDSRSKSQQSNYQNQQETDSGVNLNVQIRGGWCDETGRRQTCRCKPNETLTEIQSGQIDYKAHETTASGDSQDASTTTTGSYSQSLGSSGQPCEDSHSMMSASMQVRENNYSPSSPEPWRPSCHSRCIMPPSCINNSPRQCGPFSPFDPCHSLCRMSPPECCLSPLGLPHCSPPSTSFSPHLPKFGPLFCTEPVHRPQLGCLSRWRCIASPRFCDYPPIRNHLLVDGCSNTSLDHSSRRISPSRVCQNFVGSDKCYENDINTFKTNNRSICNFQSVNIEPELYSEPQSSMPTQDFQQNYPIERTYEESIMCQGPPEELTQIEKTQLTEQSMTIQEDQNWKPISQSFHPKILEPYTFRHGDVRVDNSWSRSSVLQHSTDKSNQTSQPIQSNHLNQSNQPNKPKQVSFAAPEPTSEDKGAFSVAEIADEQNRMVLEVRICPCDTPSTCNTNNQSTPPHVVQIPIQSQSKEERFTWNPPCINPGASQTGSSKLPYNNTCACKGPTQWMSPKASCTGVGCREPPFYGYKRTKSPKMFHAKATIA